MAARGTLPGAVNDMVEKAAGVEWRRLDSQVQDAALRLTMDSIGVASAGRVAPGVGAGLETFERLARRTAGDRQPAADVGPADAAMMLSTLIHAWDFDDVHDDAVVHAGSVVVPAALMAAQHVGTSGERILEGVVCGVEVLCRLALVVGEQPGVIRTVGLGALGAAATVARVLDLDAAGFHAALSLALPMSMSPMARQAVADGALSKRFQPGFACRHGVTAAFLSQAGLAGAADWIGGRYGLTAVLPDQDMAHARLTSSAEWQVTRLSLKPYPSCRFTHAAVAGTAQLRQTLGSSAIKGLRVHVPIGTTHEIVARPWRRRGHPLVDAQFSIPWLCAALLERGAIELSTMRSEAVEDHTIDARAATVEVIRDQRPESTVMTPVRVVCRLAGGREEEVVVRAVPGSPERPLDWSELVGKAAGCLDVSGIDRGLAKVIHEAVLTLPGCEQDSPLFAIIKSFLRTST